MADADRPSWSACSNHSPVTTVDAAGAPGSRAQYAAEQRSLTARSQSLRDRLIVACDSIPLSSPAGADRVSG